MIASCSITALAVALLAGTAAAQGGDNKTSPFKVDSRDEIVASAKTLAADLIKLYDGNQEGKVPGVLPGPPGASGGGGDYYWWTAAALWATYIDYWALTGDDTYNPLVIQGLAFQAGDQKNYLPRNQTAFALGNDDQCHWALAAITAAEYGLPTAEGGEAWVTLAKNAYKNLEDRWKEEDGKTCGGGLRWQIAVTNNGYSYKNTISNACFFHLGARLARYENDEAYAATAAEVLAWLQQVGYVDAKTGDVYDGGHTEQNCTDINKVQFSYNAAHLVSGLAYLYNQTNASTTWKTPLDALLPATIEHFFPASSNNNNDTDAPLVLFEPACESRTNACTPDIKLFKALTHAYLARTTQLFPLDTNVLLSSAKRAVAQCVGGDSGRECGFYWASGKFVERETTGVPEQLGVLSAVQNLLVDHGAAAPGTKDKPAPGGGNGNGGGNGGGPGPVDRPSMATRAEMNALVALLAGCGLYVLFSV